VALGEDCVEEGHVVSWGGRQHGPGAEEAGLAAGDIISCLMIHIGKVLSRQGFSERDNFAPIRGKRRQIIH
jgi:hypothetical protein